MESLEAKLSRVKLVIMDVDGTLVRNVDDNIEPVTRQLRRLRRLKIRFSIATCRTIFGSHRFIEEFMHLRVKTLPLITYNGGVVSAPGHNMSLHRNVIDPDVLTDLLRFC